MGKGSRARLAAQPAAIYPPEPLRHRVHGRLLSVDFLSWGTTQLEARADYEHGRVVGRMYALPSGEFWCSFPHESSFARVTLARPGVQVACGRHPAHLCLHVAFADAVYDAAPGFFARAPQLSLAAGNGRRSYQLPNGDVVYAVLGLPQGAWVTGLGERSAWVDRSAVAPRCHTCLIVNVACPHTELAEPLPDFDSEALFLPEAAGLNAVFQQDSIVLQNAAWPELYLRLSADGSYSLRSHRPDARLGAGHCGIGSDALGQLPFGERLFRAYVVDLNMAEPKDYVIRLGHRLLAAARARRAAGTQ